MSRNVTVFARTVHVALDWVIARVMPPLTVQMSVLTNRI